MQTKKSEEQPPSDTGEGRGEPLKNLIAWSRAHVEAMTDAHVASWHVLRAEMIRDEVLRLAASSGGDQGVREAPEQVHEFHQFEVCKHCGMTEAAILDQCHHCDENEIGARCYWCLRVWNGPSAALLTPPVEPDKR